MPQNIFNTVKIVEPKRSMFDLSHTVTLSCNMGELIPILNMDCLPGDKVQLSGETLVRFAPLLAPLMHRINVFIHYFFCPWRILWPNFETFITGKYLDPNFVGLPTPVWPTMDYLVVASPSGIAIQRLADYLGIPEIPAASTLINFNISAMPFAVYERVWYEYYRDQNLQNPSLTPFVLSDGDNTAFFTDLLNHGTIQNRCWEHDYFTSALPWAQKGPAVEVPMGVATIGGVPAGTLITNIDGTHEAANPLITSSEGSLEGITAGGTHIMQIHAGTIDDLRTARALKNWLEINARTGTRYKESILGHFGEDTEDYRLQRPEYICGLKTPVVVSQVLQQSASDTQPTPLGQMAGQASALSSGDEEFYHVKEHGTIMGILSIMPKTGYQQGIPKQFLKTEPTEFGFPSFAHLGEQQIDQNELYAFIIPYQDATNPLSTFGYTPRYAEYKFMMNRTCGAFKTTLNYWTMTRIFDFEQSLSSAFVISDPTTRIFAVTDPTQEHMYVQVANNITAIRPLPKYGTPTA